MARRRRPPEPNPPEPERRPPVRSVAGLRRRLAEALDMPPDVVLDVPRLIAVGHLQVLVQNYRGLVEYTPDRVVLGTTPGRLAVRGEDLRIGTISDEEIIITGQIAAIEFVR